MKQIFYYSELLRPQLYTLLEKQSEAQTTMPWETDFLQRVAPFVSGGKLLRGALLCFAYELYSGYVADQQILKAAMALELTHSGLLIHDDVMDNDCWRRGLPSLHWQYNQLGETRRVSNSQQFGTSLAICGGDALYYIGTGLLAEVRVKPAALREAFRLFTASLTRTSYGQMQDIAFDGQTALPAKAAIYELMKNKTADYSLSLPLAMGAALAGQKGRTIQRLEAIGSHAGIIYQIRDDELGILGDEQAIGKPVGSDIREGKKTLLYYYLLKQCAPADRPRLRAIFGNPASTAADLTYVRRLVQGSGVLTSLEREVQRLTARAQLGIKQLQFDQVATNELHALLDFCAQRQW
jgi:geranylgeranyl diphosphate synthase, type I